MIDASPITKIDIWFAWYPVFAWRFSEKVPPAGKRLVWFKTIWRCRSWLEGSKTTIYSLSKGRKASW